MASCTNEAETTGEADPETPEPLLSPGVKSINLIPSSTTINTINGSDQPVIDPTTSSTLFRNLKNAKRFAIDIGGSLTKIAYYSTISHKRIKNSFEYSTWEGKRLHFIKFETLFIQECLSFIQKHLTKELEEFKLEGKRIKATGGGSYKYSSLIQEKLGLTLEKEDEISCLIKGANFLLKNVPDEAFVFERKCNPEYIFESAGNVVFPYLLVNIGSGVSILKVEGEDKYERIGGTATGGGTFWGLGSLLTAGKVKEFDELLNMAEKGDHRNVDMLVKDIYSGDYAKLGLPGDLIASSFGKAAAHSPLDFNVNDAIRSLLFTIVNDIGQIACLYALQHGLKRIYFGGYFLRNHPLSMYAISYAIKYWSKGGVKALFLRHEGYLGAIGAFLKGTEELDYDKYSWQENFAGSSLSGLMDEENVIKRGINVEQIEIDRMEKPFGFFPLIQMEGTKYFADCVDLTKEQDAREYWLTCFQGWVERITTLAMESQPDNPTSTERALKCRRKLISRLNYLNQNPCAFGLLTVRSLLDLFEQSLREYDFPDPYWNLKQSENSAAFSELDKRLSHIDTLEWKERQMELIWGVLAGNVFDWGAREVTNLLEGPDQFGFMEARMKIENRPWLIDSLDDWIDRLNDEKKGRHKCVAVFVDNSGFDFVCGIIPLVREFLSRGTKVILCSNSYPAVNDMTYNEMVSLLEEISLTQPWLKEGLIKGSLKLVGTGQGSPCLDLSRVNQDLVHLVSEMETDLVIIEGMGRSIHTNLTTKFNCEVIKLAVIKNKWLAERFGGKLFSVVFKYERPN